MNKIVTRLVRHFFLAVICSFMTTFSYADIPAWKIVPEKSELTFTAIQNDAPVSGKFTKFNGKIEFDPAQLALSRINIVVDMNSVEASYKDLVDTLKSSDWFDIKVFPNATFEASKFIHKDKNHYVAEGMLTIRDKKIPLQLMFTLDEYSATKARVTGEAVIKRTLVGVGQGEWKATDVVKDDVKVGFSIEAVR